MKCVACICNNLASAHQQYDVECSPVPRPLNAMMLCNIVSDMCQQLVQLCICVCGLSHFVSQTVLPVLLAHAMTYYTFFSTVRSVVVAVSTKVSVTLLRSLPTDPAAILLSTISLESDHMVCFTLLTDECVLMLSRYALTCTASCEHPVYDLMSPG